MRIWQIQEAKTHLSQLVRDTEHAGPQSITWHGREVAVVLSRADYDQLAAKGQSLLEFMQHSPLHDAEDIVFDRNVSTTRTVAL